MLFLKSRSGAREPYSNEDCVAPPPSAVFFISDKFFRSIRAHPRKSAVKPFVFLRG